MKQNDTIHLISQGGQRVAGRVAFVSGNSKSVAVACDKSLGIGPLAIHPTLGLVYLLYSQDGRWVDCASGQTVYVDK